MGRTNLMIAAYIVNKEMIKPDMALERVKKARPAHLVTDKQEESLWDYYYTLESEK
jgi:protein-tyrosine phosphatase